MENCLWVENPILCFDEYLESRGYSKKTRITYKSIFNGLVAFMGECGENLSSVNERILQEWLNKCAVSYQTEIRYLSLISAISDELFDKSIIDINSAKALIHKKSKLKRGKTAKRLPIALDEKEFDLLMTEISKPGVLPRRRIAILIMLGCGLRVSELCGLQVKSMHLDVERPYLSVIGKGDKEREVPIPEEICRDLALHEADLIDLGGCFIGVERNGIIEPFSPSGVFRMVQEVMRSAGIVKRRMSPHVLRHTYATRQLQAGVPMATLTMWMGHDSSVTTMIYQHAVIARSSVRPKF